jgi:hypothetical protein
LDYFYPNLENADSCRSVVLNSKKLFLADRLSDFFAPRLSPLAKRVIATLFSARYNAVRRRQNYAEARLRRYV